MTIQETCTKCLKDFEDFESRGGSWEGFVSIDVFPMCKQCSRKESSGGMFAGNEGQDTREAIHGTFYRGLDKQEAGPRRFGRRNGNVYT